MNGYWEEAEMTRRWKKEIGFPAAEIIDWITKSEDPFSDTAVAVHQILIEVVDDEAVIGRMNNSEAEMLKKLLSLAEEAVG